MPIESQSNSGQFGTVEKAINLSGKKDGLIVEEKDSETYSNEFDNVSGTEIEASQSA